MQRFPRCGTGPPVDIDVDIEGGTARIRRSFSSGRTLGPTKTGRERVVELSSRLRSVLFGRQPTVYPPPTEATVFPDFSGGMLIPVYFRNKVFRKIVHKALGENRRFSPPLPQTHVGIASYGQGNAAQVDSGPRWMDNREGSPRQLRPPDARRVSRLLGCARNGSRRPLTPAVESTLRKALKLRSATLAPAPGPRSCT